MEFYTNGAAHFQHQDWQGTERIRTSYNGAVEATYKSLPYGDAFAAYGQDSDPYHFGMLDHDGETDTDHAQFRQYSPTQGRWMSPDPYDGSYDFSNPQSFNRYSYVMNNPLSLKDPTGQSSTQPVQCGTDSSGAPTFCMSSTNDNNNDDDGFNLFDPSTWFGGGPSFHGSLKPRPLAAPSIAMAMPPTDPCQQKAQNIQHLRNEILGRSQAYSDNVLPLPLTGPMSRAGHIQQIGDKQASLRNALNDYRTSGCGGPSGNAGLPADVSQVAFAPLPTLSPSRFSVPGWVAPAAVITGGVACAIFVPGCLEVELTTAPAW